MTILFCFFMKRPPSAQTLDGASIPPKGLVEHFEEGFDTDLELFGIRLRVVRHDLEEWQIQFLTHELLTDHDSTS